MEPYLHTVQYYETDKMGITHHSNYVRWMEEARIDFLRQIGWSYDKLEETGISSPVIGIDGKYKISTTFAEKISIAVRLVEFNGVKLTIGYSMTNEKGENVFEGQSRHCFLGRDGRPLRLKKDYPDFYQKMSELVE